MTTLTVAVPSWEAIDARLATLQGEVRWGTLAAQGKALVAVLAEVRGDLAVLRALAGVAQRAEQPPFKRSIAGSTPAPRTTTAREQGYTGNMCGVCGSARMRRSGPCEMCDAFGGNTGCF